MKKRALFILLTALVGILALTIGCSKDDDNGGDGDNSTDSNDGYVTDPGGDTDTDTDTDIDTDVNYPDSDSEPEYDTAPFPESCDESDYVIKVNKIDMLVVLDRSYSMEKDEIWEPMGAALTAVTDDYKEMVNFGLMMFPDDDDVKCVAEKPGENDTPCIAPTNPDVPLTDETAAAQIAAVFEANSGVSPCGGTPIAETLVSAKAYLKGLEKKKRYVLLATDGAPNCNDEFTELDGETCKCTNTFEEDACKNNPLNCLDDVRTVAATEDLYADADAGVETYVIGMGEQVNNSWDKQLNAIAAAGKTGTYLPAADTNKLKDAFETVTQNVVNCKFAIDWDGLEKDASDDKDKINFFCKENADDPLSWKNLVRLDEECNNSTGWDWIDGNTVKFCQGACDRLKRRQCTSVKVTFGCADGTIVVK